MLIKLTRFTPHLVKPRVSTRGAGFTFSVFIFILMFLYSFIDIAGADIVYLKNGYSINGIIKAEDEYSIDLEIEFGTIKFEKGEIERIYRSTPQETLAIKQKWEKEKLEAEKRLIQEQLKKKAETKQSEIQKEKGHIFVEAALNNKIRALLVLDTGASMVVLSNSIGKKLGIETSKEKDIVQLQLADGNNVNASYVVLESVIVQGLEAKNIEAAVLTEEAKEANFKDGLLGMSFLDKFNFTVNYKEGKFILEKPSSPENNLPKADQPRPF